MYCKATPSATSARVNRFRQMPRRNVLLQAVERAGDAHFLARPDLGAPERLGSSQIEKARHRGINEAVGERVQAQHLPTRLALRGEESPCFKQRVGQILEHEQRSNNVLPSSRTSTGTLPSGAFARRPASGCQASTGTKSHRAPVSLR